MPMKLIIDGHGFRYETEKLCAVFFPNERIETVAPGCADGCYALTRRSSEGDADLLYVRAAVDGRVATAQRRVPHTEADLEGACELQLALALYQALSELTGYTPAWGILTGVRPAKLMSKCCEELGEQGAKKYFTDTLLVSDSKAALALRVSKKENVIVALSQPDSYSLYISIPFCPTRCSYCSFVSHSNESAKRLIPEYVELLCRETEQTARLARQLKLKLESIYFGGGTPTVLSAGQLELVMRAVSDNFDVSRVREYTVEAGRPDSITEEKLEVIKRFSAGRISINPQTFDDNILSVIGRRHTSRQTSDAFAMARNAGIGNINMDLIAGLPTDTAEGFRRSLESTLELEPESITVHTLALKRSSVIVTQQKDSGSARSAGEMLSAVPGMLEPRGYEPYYMYRQSRILGNLENVGWAKPGYESLYNVFMMEECHTVLGAGAAAVTKLKAPNSCEIERIFNFKYPYEYIDRFDELMNRKEYVRRFYERYTV